MNQNRFKVAVVDADEMDACPLAASRSRYRRRPVVAQARTALNLNAETTPTLERKD